MAEILMLLAGFAVYAGYGLWGCAWLAGAVLVSFGLGLLIPKHRWVMWVSVGVNALILLTVKLLPLTHLTWAAPLGISYYTLQIISYHADLYRGKYPPAQSLLRYSLYLTYLPHIFLGPIERYDTMVPALFENRRMSWDGISRGGARILWGSFKKLVIAARAGVLVGAVSADPEAFRGAYALAAMVLYSVQLYADFSGGIDMVLGVSRMLGVTLSENFDAPFFSESFQEFWRRWHMTLGSWLREYVYIPLGGNRKGRGRKVFNLLVTFLVSGLWHGVHYLLWGLLNGIFVAFGNKFKTKWKNLNRLLTFLLVSLLWSFFIWPDTLTAVKMMGSVFCVFHYGAFFSGLGALGLECGEGLVLGAAAVILWLADVYRVRLKGWFGRLTPAGRLAVIGALGLTVLVFGMYGIGFNAEEFIYSRF